MTRVAKFLVALFLLAGCKKDVPSGPIYVQKNITLRESINWLVVGEWSSSGGAVNDRSRIAGVHATHVVARQDGTATIVGDGKSFEVKWGTSPEGTLDIFFPKGPGYGHAYTVAGDKLTIIGDAGPIEFRRESRRDASPTPRP